LLLRLTTLRVNIFPNSEPLDPCIPTQTYTQHSGISITCVLHHLLYRNNRLLRTMCFFRYRNFHNGNILSVLRRLDFLFLINRKSFFDLETRIERSTRLLRSFQSRPCNQYPSHKRTMTREGKSTSILSKSFLMKFLKSGFRAPSEIPKSRNEEDDYTANEQ